MSQEERHRDRFRKMFSSSSRPTTPDPPDRISRSTTPEPPGSSESPRFSLTRISSPFRRSVFSRPTLGESSTKIISPQSPPAPGQTIILRVPVQSTGPPSSILSPDPQVIDPADDIFREALESHKQSLGPVQQQAFIGASAVGLMDIIKELNKQHSEDSRTRRSAMRAQGFLQVADGYLTVLGIAIQHSPEYSALVVGGLKFLVDIGRRYTGFFDKLDETMQRFGGYLDYLARYARVYGHYAEVKNALCDAYGDLILFCKTGCAIFMNKDGKLNSRISARVLFGQLTRPLETSFDAINSQFNEHIVKVEKTAHILESERKLLKESAEDRDRADRTRSSLLSWLSKLEPEDDLQRIYAKRHPNTGMWFLESEQLRGLLTASNHCLLWCFGLAGVGKSVLASILIAELTARHPFDERIGVAFFYFNFQNEAIAQTPASFLSILIKQLCRRKSTIPEGLKTFYNQCFRDDRKPKLAELQDQFQAIVGTFDEVFLVIDALDECEKHIRQELLPYICTLFDRCPGKLKTIVTSRPEIDIEHAFTSANFEMIKIEATKVNDDIAAYVCGELADRNHEYCDMDLALQQEIKDVLVSQAGGMFLWVRCQLDSIYLQRSNPDIRACLQSLPVDMTETYRRILDRIYAQPPAVVAIAKRALTWVVTAARPLTPEELAIFIAIEITSHTNELSNNENGVLSKYKPHVAIDACCGLLSIDGQVVRPIHFTVQEFIKRGEMGIGTDIEANAFLAESMIHFMICEIRSYGIPSEYSTSVFQFWNYHVRKLPLPLPEKLEFILKHLSSSARLRLSAYRKISVRSYRISELDFFAAFDLLLVYQNFYPFKRSAENSHKVQSAIIHAAECNSLSAVVALLDMLEVGLLTETLEDALRVASREGHVEVVRLLIARGVDVNAEGGIYGNALQAAASGNIIHYPLIGDEFGGACASVVGLEFDNPLQAANGLHFRKTVECLLSAGAHVNTQGGIYGNPLQAAVTGCNSEIVQCLLASGADVNAQGGQFGNALQAAARRWNKEAVQYLLTAGANVNASGGRYGNAIQAAAVNNNRGTVELLLALGANVNAQGGEFGNALIAATQNQNEGLVKYLISAGADLNAHCDKYGSALQVAASTGSREIVEFLVVAGADLNGQGGIWGNAIQAAAVAENGGEIVGYLLAAGTDITAGGAVLDRALQEAARIGKCDVLNVLLAGGADVNARSKEHGSALQVAARYSYNEVVKLLLAAGADVNAQGGKLGNALQDAAANSNGNGETIELLLAAGADVNAAGGKYGNALQAAAFGWEMKPVKCLVAAGANVNATGGKFGTALQAAAQSGRREIVKYLLAAGANVNATGGEYGTPLQAAVQCGYSEIVECLLAGGSDVNVTGGEYGTPLQAAAQNGNSEIVKCLLAAGADVNAMGGEYGNALQAAATSPNCIGIVECLLIAGANVHATGGKFGNALQAAAFGNAQYSYGLGCKTKTVKCLLAAGANVNATGGEYGTALQAAATGGKRKAVECLLAAGADVNATGGKYGNALQGAARGNSRTSSPIVECLLAAGADVTSTGGKYGNALQAAARHGTRQIVECLLAAGADVNAAGGKYGNALRAAELSCKRQIAQSKRKMVECLLAAGAEINAGDGLRDMAVGDF